MALQGTLKDFGIADILQLIGQQQKTGTLIVRSKEQVVQVGFVDEKIAMPRVQRDGRKISLAPCWCARASSPKKNCRKH